MTVRDPRMVEAFDLASDAYDAAGDAFENGELMEAIEYGVNFVRALTKMLAIEHASTQTPTG